MGCVLGFIGRYENESMLRSDEAPRYRYLAKVIPACTAYNRSMTF
jgi:hypothetical protein